MSDGRPRGDPLNDASDDRQPPCWAWSVVAGEVAPGGHYVTLKFADESGLPFSLCFPFQTLALSLASLQQFTNAALQQQALHGLLPSAWPADEINMPRITTCDVFRDGREGVIRAQTRPRHDPGESMPPFTHVMAGDRATLQGLGDAIQHVCWELWQFEKGRN